MVEFNPRYTITNRILSALSRVERAQGFIEAATLSQEWLQEMKRRALVLEAHHTTHIEGTQLTLDQAQRLLDGKLVPEADPDDVRELLNYGDAYNLVSEYVASGGAISEGLIRELHRRLVQGVRGGAADPGAYRRLQNYVVNSTTGEIVYTPPPAYEVPRMMAELVAWLEAEPDHHPVLVAGIAQFQLVHIHPFLDGNGRTSRLVTTVCLYRAGYDFKQLFSISEHYDQDRAGFYSAIQSVRNNEMDMTKWLEYFTNGLVTQLTELRRLGESAIRRAILSRQYRLSRRQSQALAHVIEHGHLTVGVFAGMYPDVSRRTLQRDLHSLVEKGLLDESGTGPTDPAKRYLLVDSFRNLL